MAQRHVSLKRDSVQAQGTRVKADVRFESAESPYGEKIFAAAIAERNKREFPRAASVNR
jgi:hypothetical protein